MEKTSQQEKTKKLSLRAYDSFLREMGSYSPIFWDANRDAQIINIGLGLQKYSTSELLKCFVRYRLESGDLEFKRIKILLERALQYWEKYEPRPWMEDHFTKREINRQKKKFKALGEIVENSCKAYEQNRYGHFDESSDGIRFSDRYKRYRETDPFSELSWAKLLINYNRRKKEQSIDKS